MNNKGMTLVELLVSFLLVGVTIIYFMQAMLDVKRIYKNTQDDTKKYVDRTYIIKIFDACMNNGRTSENTQFTNECNKDKLKTKYNIELKSLTTSSWKSGYITYYIYTFETTDNQKFYIYR